MSDIELEAKKDGEIGAPNSETGEAKPENEGQDPTKGLILIDEKEGWLTVRINVHTRGLYSTLGFFREVEDHLRKYYIERMKERDQKELIKPGWRGFNPFGNKKR